MASEEVEVKTYSGLVYAERPASFRRRGKESVVTEIRKAWLGPGTRHFVVFTADGAQFHLVYDEATDTWSLGRESRAGADGGPSRSS